MNEPYFIRRGDIYLHGFSQSGNPVWTLDLEDCLWLEEEMARRWVKSLQFLFDLSGLEIERV